MMPPWRTPPRLLESRLDAEFYLPKHLATVRLIRATSGSMLLGDVEVSGSYGVLPKSAEYGQGKTPLLRGRDLDGQAIVNIPGDAPRVPDTYQASRRARLRPNELLLLIKGATIDAAQSIGVVSSHWTTPAIASGSLYKFGVRAPHDAYYLCAFFGTRYGRDQKARAIANTGVNYNDQDSIRAFWLALPDPTIQRAIGNKVRKAERLRELAMARQAKIDQSVLSLLGLPNDSEIAVRSFWATAPNPNRLNPTEYHPNLLATETTLLSRGAVPLRHLLPTRGDISGGTTPKGATYADAGVRFLRVQNVRPNRFDFSDVVFIDKSTDELLRRSRGRMNDVVMTITGYPGTASVIRQRHLPLNMNQHCVRFQVTKGWSPFFVAAFLNSPWGRSQVARRAIGGTREALDYPSILSILVPPAGAETQMEVESLVIAVDDALDEASVLIEAARASVESLIDGTLDEPSLLAEGAAIDQWLLDNPSPYDKERA